MQIQNASLSGRASDTSVMFLTANASFDGANFKYISTNLACQYRQQAGEHYWYTATSGTAGNTISFTQAMALNNNGGFQALNTIGVGNATPSTSGAGITFPATVSLSSNANTLDDYEEGVWVPSFTLDSGSATLDSSSGNYVKVGKQVTLTMTISFSSATAALINTITGLPFIAEDVAAIAVGAVRENGNTGFMWQLRPSRNTTTANIRKYDNTQVVTAGDQFIGTVTYFTSV
jgi:hypothetical protein